MEARRHPPAFALIELAAVLAAILLLAAALLISTSDTRRLARLGEDTANLRRIGSLTGSYAADNADLFWTFSWKRNQSYQTLYPELNNAATDQIAANNQLAYLLRTTANRPDMPVVPTLVPHFFYSHLVLATYAGLALPATSHISTADTYRLKWASDPACFDQGCFLPFQPSPDPAQKRNPYSSSFSTTLAFYDRSVVSNRISSAGIYNAYVVFSGTELGAFPLTAVRFPSQKVLLHDQNARHFGPRQPYCTHPEARLPLLMTEGSVAVRSAADANPGSEPNNPSSPAAPSFSYLPSGRPWEPPSLLPSGDIVQGRFRYTRRGLEGWDFGRPEVIP